MGEGERRKNKRREGNKGGQMAGGGRRMVRWQEGWDKRRKEGKKVNKEGRNEEGKK